MRVDQSIHDDLYVRWEDIIGSVVLPHSREDLLDKNQSVMRGHVDYRGPLGPSIQKSEL